MRVQLLNQKATLEMFHPEIYRFIQLVTLDFPSHLLTEYRRLEDTELCMNLVIVLNEARKRILDEPPNPEESNPFDEYPIFTHDLGVHLILSPWMKDVLKNTEFVL